MPSKVVSKNKSVVLGNRLLHKKTLSDATEMGTVLIEN